MSRCYAMTKKSRPCRNSSRIIGKTPDEILYSHLCDRHREYKFNIIIKNGLEWKPVERHYIERVLKYKLVNITLEDVCRLRDRRGWNNNSSYTHFILLCSRWVEGFDREWNPMAFNIAIKDLWRQSRSIGPVYVCWDDLITLGSCVKDCVQGFFLLLMNIPYSYNWDELSHIQWKVFISKVLSSSWGEKALLNIDILNESHWQNLKDRCCERKSKYLLDLIQSGDLFNTVKREKEELYKKLTRRIEHYKEELMEVVWKDPDWVIDWCIDIEEKKGCIERWSKS